MDWSLGAFLQYGSGLPLTPPAATNTNYLGTSEMYRVPGQPLYLKSLNCGCINVYSDVVLNPKAWANPVNGTFGPATGTLYGDFRQARRPQENLNFARTFRMKERYTLELRAEFVNIFNRTVIGNPGTSCSRHAAQQERAESVLRWFWRRQSDGVGSECGAELHPECGCRPTVPAEAYGHLDRSL